MITKDLLTIVDNKAIPSPYAKMILEYSDIKQRYAVGLDVWKKNFM